MTMCRAQPGQHFTGHQPHAAGAPRNVDCFRRDVAHGIVISACVGAALDHKPAVGADDLPHKVMFV